MKTVFIIRGVPGSNKRIYAQGFAGKEGVIHSPDDFLLPEDCGRIDRTNRAGLNRHCLDAFIRSLQLEVETVVYCSTNIIHFRFKEFVEAARFYKYNVVYVTTDHPDPSIAAKRTTRNISVTEIEAMIHQFQP